LGEVPGSIPGWALLFCIAQVQYRTDHRQRQGDSREPAFLLASHERYRRLSPVEHGLGSPYLLKQGLTENRTRDLSWNEDATLMPQYVQNIVL
jgi:hypothetical protein